MSRHTQTNRDNKFGSILKLHEVTLQEMNYNPYHKDVFTFLDSESQQVPMLTHESASSTKKNQQHMKHFVFTYALFLNQVARLLNVTPHCLSVLNRKVAFYTSAVGFLR